MVCNHCKLNKPLERFATAPTKLGYRRKCKDCVADYYREYFKRNPDKYEKQKQYVAKNDETYKRTRYRHGLTDKSFEELYLKYDGRCWSCKAEKATCIDHDHNCCPQTFSCGDCVRGILCSGCNTSLGLLKEDVDRIESLGLYLTETRGGSSKVRAARLISR